VTRIFALPVLAFALLPFHATSSDSFDASIRPLSAPQRAQLTGRFWHSGCPVSLSQLRLLTVEHWGFDRRAHTGELVVNKNVAAPLESVFRQLYALRFPIRHMRFSEVYGPARARPKDGDLSGSFECRQAVPSPCTGGSGTGSWSNHAYGHALDLNPRENPYVGCGMSRDPRSRPYFDRSRLRKGMVTPAVVRAFASIGWGWGGSWAGDTKDYMHFSVNGH
jgi:D-alanyl-D-alanine carboxypeptidase-like protein